MWAGVIALTSFAIAIGSANAEEIHPAQMVELIKQYESDGGRNLPNFRYDAKHTASGICQITNETWRKVAPLVDIDIVKFDTAGSASEHAQNQVCFKLLSLSGVKPWTCEGCNDKLRKVLSGKIIARPAVSAETFASKQKPEPRAQATREPSAPAAARSAPTWIITSDQSEATSSFVITATR